MSMRARATAKQVKPRPDWEFVEVEWSDIQSWAEWRDLDDKHEPCRCISRGWIIEENAKTVLLCSCFIFKEKDEDKQTIGSVTVIPKGCIKSRKKLRVS